MARFSRRDYADAVDRAIDCGVRYTRTAGLPYDIMRFARAMWRAKPFMHRASTGKLGGFGEALYKDLVTAIMVGNDKEVSNVMSEMLKLAKKHRFRMPNVERIPEPKAIHRGRRRLVRAAETSVRAKPFEEQVDETLARGMEAVIEHERRHGYRRSYDIMFFAKALWRSQPFMDYALAGDIKDKGIRKLRVLRQDFLLAVHDGNRGAVKRMLAEMDELGKKDGFAPLPEYDLAFPTPKLLLN